MLCLLLEPNPTATLLAAALTHDLAEQYTGDVPATAKWASEELTQALRTLEDRYERFRYDLSPHECRVLKQADMLDLCFKCLEEFKMGDSEVAFILNRGLHYLLNNNPLAITTSLVKEIRHEFQC